MTVFFLLSLNIKKNIYCVWAFKQCQKNLFATFRHLKIHGVAPLITDPSSTSFTNLSTKNCYTGHMTQVCAIPHMTHYRVGEVNLHSGGGGVGVIYIFVVAKKPLWRWRLTKNMTHSTAHRLI